MTVSLWPDVNDHLADYKWDVGIYVESLLYIVYATKSWLKSCHTQHRTAVGRSLSCRGVQMRNTHGLPARSLAVTAGYCAINMYGTDKSLSTMILKYNYF